MLRNPESRTPPLASTYLLAGPGRDALQQLVRAERARLFAALVRVSPSEPICSLGLLYTDQDDLPTVSYAYAQTISSRDRALADGMRSGLQTLWSPAEWEIEDFVGALDGRLSGPAKAVARDLFAHGCTDPEGSFLMDLAYAVNRSTLPVAVTPDFACWASEQPTDAPYLWMTAVATDAAAATYRANGWLRPG